MKRYQILFIGFFLTFLPFTLSAYAQSDKSSKPSLIRDTAVAEGKETVEESLPKEQNPELAKLSINIGNFYFKAKNYTAAIQRYLEALEYQPDSIPAFKALVKAYVKNGETAKAISAYKSYLEKHPDLPSTHEFRNNLAELEKLSD